MTTPPRGAEGHDGRCDGILFPHVIYDYEAAGYRAQIRCQCALERVTSGLLTDFTTADQEAHSAAAAGEAA